MNGAEFIQKIIRAETMNNDEKLLEKVLAKRGITFEAESGYWIDTIGNIADERAVMVKEAIQEALKHVSEQQSQGFGEWLKKYKINMDIVKQTTEYSDDDLEESWQAATQAQLQRDVEKLRKMLEKLPSPEGGMATGQELLLLDAIAKLKEE